MWECLKGCQGNKDHFNELINTDLVARDTGSCALVYLWLKVGSGVH